MENEILDRLDDPNYGDTNFNGIPDSQEGPPAEIQNQEQSGVIQPEVVTSKGSFPAAFRSQIGNSTVDLSIPENAQRMKDEYRHWWALGTKKFLYYSR